MGKRDAIGYLDIYVNGFLPLQPGCLGIMCSHNRSWLIYAETVFPGQQHNFKAFKLDAHDENDFIYIGYDVNVEKRGKYFVATNAESPYGKNAPMGKPRCVEYDDDDNVK